MTSNYGSQGGEAVLMGVPLTSIMNDIHEKVWYVVYTKPRWEKKVAERLESVSIEQYCPLNKVLRQWHDRKKYVHVPLFNSYVFVKANMSEFSTIRQLNGVVNFVYWLGKPAIVKDEEIEAIQTLLHEHSDIQMEKIQVNINDRVRITYGPFMHHEGKVMELLSSSVKVALPSLGFALVAQVAKSGIERIIKHFSVENIE